MSKNDAQGRETGGKSLRSQAYTRLEIAFSFHPHSQDPARKANGRTAWRKRLCQHLYCYDLVAGIFAGYSGYPFFAFAENLKGYDAN
jgi:hypothetical protein